MQKSHYVQYTPFKMQEEAESYHLAHLILRKYAPKQRLSYFSWPLK